MPQFEKYDLEQVADFLLTEKLAIHGLSSEVYEQNQAVISHIQTVAQGFGPHLMGVQLFGSRATGASIYTSDIDLNLLLLSPNYSDRSDDFRIREEERFEEELGSKLHHDSLTYDLHIDFVATLMLQLHGDTPDDPQLFRQEIESYPYEWAALFEEGVYDTPGRSLAALAATSVLLNSPVVGHGDWSTIRDKHTTAFLGSRPHLIKKLEERSGFSGEDIETAITPELMEKRQQTFGLPSLSQHHTQLMEWYERQEPAIRIDPAHELL